MFDVITFGSATKDIFLNTKEFLVKDSGVKSSELKILLPFGLKIDIKDVYFHSGGGGANTATSFAMQGFKTAYCGTVSRDWAGEDILRELKEKKIETKFVFRTEKKPSNLSIIFSTPKERTILAYKGASNELEENLSWSDLKKTKWVYLAPLAGQWIHYFKKIVDWANKNKIKVFVNPGNSQLKMNRKTLKLILKKTDILFLNLEEARILVKDFEASEDELISKIKKFFSGILIITNGKNKIFLAKDNNIFSVLPPRTKAVDKTGAGDAFGSGFLSGFMQSEDIEYSIGLAIANAISCLKKRGAKEGLLEKKEEQRSGKKIKIKKLNYA